MKYYRLFPVLLIFQNSFPFKISFANSKFKRNNILNSVLDPSQLGDCSDINYKVKFDGNDFETPFDQGDVKFIINGGGYAQFVHNTAAGLQTGESITTEVSGGQYSDQLAAYIPIQNAPTGLVVGEVVKLSNGLRARVTEVTEKQIKIDANSPLAGKMLSVEMICKKRSPARNFAQATFAGGCFWGLELAFQRIPGVVYTAVGYTQGSKKNPNYEEVCEGITGHAEAVTVMYDPAICDYDSLLTTFWTRHDPTQKNRQGNDVGTQYRGGIYYHSLEQKMQSEASMFTIQKNYKTPLATELLPATEFWLAEDYHQQYLEKGGQNAKKLATEQIRCYG